MHDTDDDDDRATPHSFGVVLDPHEAAEPILSKGVRGALTEWLTEIWSADDLHAAGLKPRHRAVFTGKPGTGKTTLAHHLAARLGLGMLVVQPELLQSKWVNQTGEQIGRLFKMAAAADPPLMLFLDEFDALAQARMNAEQASDREHNKNVNVLLQRIEQHKGFIIAATNFGQHLDPAIWRRFDVHIDIDLPGRFERERILARYLEPWGLPKSALRRLAEACETASPALMRQLAEAIKRNIVIGPKVGWPMARDVVVDRVLAAIQPHPDLGKPRLWSLGARDAAVQAMPWPLPLAADVRDDAPAEAAPEENVVHLRRPA
jgi:SpoVK/Ycf46/Vps4 family AAA+-type ATPase